MPARSALLLRSVIAVGLLLGCGSALGSINLELRPSFQSASLGSTVSFGLYAVSDSSQNQGLAAVQVVLSWQTSYLHMLSNTQTGAATLLSSSFPSPDPYGLNETSLPSDGNALYVAYATFGGPLYATPSGVLLTNLRFQALVQTSFTPIDILEVGGTPMGRTTVFDGTVSNLDVTGNRIGSGIQIVPGPGGVGMVLVLGISAAARRRSRSTVRHT
jgi:hypothetical protein